MALLLEELNKRGVVKVSEGQSKETMKKRGKYDISPHFEEILCCLSKVKIIHHLFYSYGSYRKFSELGDGLSAILVRVLVKRRMTVIANSITAKKNQKKTKQKKPPQTYLCKIIQNISAEKKEVSVINTPPVILSKLPKEKDR